MTHIFIYLLTFTSVNVLYLESIKNSFSVLSFLSNTRVSIGTKNTCVLEFMSFQANYFNHCVSIITPGSLGWINSRSKVLLKTSISTKIMSHYSTVRRKYLLKSMTNGL